MEDAKISMNCSICKKDIGSDPSEIWYILDILPIEERMKYPFCGEKECHTKILKIFYGKKDQKS